MFLQARALDIELGFTAEPLLDPAWFRELN